MKQQLSQKLTFLMKICLDFQTIKQNNLQGGIQL